jgi:acetyl esterase
MAPPAAIGAVNEHTVQGPGGAMTFRTYSPISEGPFFHGSGLVLCSLGTHDGMCRNLCAGADCVVVSGPLSPSSGLIARRR